MYVGGGGGGGGGGRYVHVLIKKYNDNYIHTLPRSANILIAC